MKNYCFSLLLALLLSLLVTPIWASTLLYDNGPIKGTINARGIADSEVSNFFICITKTNFIRVTFHTTDAYTRKSLKDRRSKAIKEKDDLEHELSFKREQLKDGIASMDYQEEYLKGITNSKKRAEEHH